MVQVYYNLWLRTQDLTWRGVPFQPNLIIWPFHKSSVAHTGRVFLPHEKLAMICHKGLVYRAASGEVLPIIRELWSHNHPLFT